MKKLILLFLLVPWLCFADTNPYILGSVDVASESTYIYDLPCTDNAANTTVTNNGTGSDWRTAPAITTSDLYTANGFLLSDTASYAIYSTVAWTSEKFEVKYEHTSINATASNNEVWWTIGSGSVSLLNNTMIMRRLDAATQPQMLIQDNSGNSVIATCTNWTADTNKHDITITVDASTGGAWSVVVKQGAKTLTWSAALSVADAAVFNVQMGFSGPSYRMSATINNVTVEDQE